MRPIFILLWLLPLQFAYTQSSFNYLFDYGYPINHFRDVIVHDDTIVGLGIAYPDSFNLQQGILLAKIDSNGTLLQKKLILDSLGRDLVIVNPGSKIIHTSDGGYALMAAPIQTDGSILFKLNHNLDIERIIEFEDPSLRSDFIYNILETPNGYLLYGILQKMDYQLFGFIRHITKSGNLIWNKNYLYDGYENFLNDVKIINDSTLIACHAVVIDRNTYKNFSAIRKLNLFTGNQVAYWESAVNSPQGRIYHIVPTTDSGFMTLGVKLIGPNQVNYKVQPVFSKFSSDLAVEWSKPVGKIAYSPGSFLNETHLGHNNTYYSIGRTTVDTFQDGYNNEYLVGWIYKQNSNGDSIWSKTIRSINGPYDYVNIDTKLYAGGVLSSGSVIAGGYSVIGWKYYPWLVKITAEGCVEGFTVCSPPTSGAQEQAIVLERRGNLRIIPNPASEKVKISFPDMATYGNIQIMDALGRVVVSLHFDQPTRQVSIDIAHLIAGHYFVTASTAKGVLSGTMVVVHQ
ncbi:MAG: Secretion system C-terminal sorting domain [Bacteroidota bacterium]|jgi:hypothetical protein